MRILMTLSIAQWCVVIAALASTLPSSAASNCLATCDCCFCSPKGASYDLTKLILASPYQLNDKYDTPDETERDYIYYFNLCKSVGSTVPNVPFSSAPTQCTDDGSPLTSVGPAYQIKLNQTGRNCWSLGRLESRTFSEESDAAAGVRLVYSNGDTCFRTGKNRSLTINVECDPRQEDRVTTHVEETANCEYEITILSKHACPLECGNSDQGVCTNNGVCNYDADAQRARCFCYVDRSGEFCTDDAARASSPSSPTTALIVVTILLLISLLVLAFFVYRKLRALRSAEDSAYGALESDLGAGSGHTGPLRDSSASVQ